MTRIAACAVVSALGAGPLATLAVGTNSAQQSCSAKTKDLYGFQCQGYSNVGAGLEPVTFIGTVAGSETGVFDGYGTFSRASDRADSTRWGRPSSRTRAVLVTFSTTSS